jgi:tubulin beta
MVGFAPFISRKSIQKR